MRLCLTLIVAPLVAACAHRAARPKDDYVPPPMTWAEQLTCAADLLRRAGFDVTQDSVRLSARRRGGMISANPPSYQQDEVTVAMITGSLGGLVLELRPATTRRGPRGQIGAGTFEVFEVAPAIGQDSYAQYAPASGEVQAVAYRIQKNCRQL
jgi:hypothetical protein